MNYNRIMVIAWLFFSCVPVVGMQIDNQKIDALVEKMRTQQSRRAAVLDIGVALGAATTIGYLVYWVYNSSITSTYGPQAQLDYVAENMPYIMKAVECEKNNQGPWHRLSLGWLTQTAGSVVAQSLAMQGLQPFYKRVKHYLLPEMTVSIGKSWFLYEQVGGVGSCDMSHKVIISHELYNFVTHIEAAERAYQEHETAVLKESAEYIISHMRVSSHNLLPYEVRMMEKVSEKITFICQEMLQDCHRKICRAEQVVAFKDMLRRLRFFNTYCM